VARYQVTPALTTRDTYVFGDPEARGRDQIFLGRLAETGPSRDVIWDTSGETVFAIFGKRGSGKSYALGSILESLGSRDSIGRASTSATRAVLVFDTLGIFWTLARPFSEAALEEERWSREARAMRRWGLLPTEIDSVNLSPAGYARPGDLADREFVLSPTSLSGEDWCDLLNLDPYSDRMGQLMLDLWDRTTEQSSSWDVGDLVNVLTTDAAIQSLYSPETCRALTQRLKAFARLTIFGQPGTDLGELLAGGRVTILSLAALSDELRRVIVAVLMRQILNRRARTAAVEKRIRFDPALSADEADGLRADRSDGQRLRSPVGHRR